MSARLSSVYALLALSALSLPSMAAAGGRASADENPLGLDAGGVTYDFASISRRLEAERLRPPHARILLRNAVPNALDGTFALSEGQVGLYVFEWRGTDATAWDPARLRVELLLPEAVRLVDCNFAERETAKTRRQANGDVHWTFEVRHGMGRFLPDIPATNAFSRHAPFQLLLEPSGGCGTSGQGALSVSYDGRRVSNVERVRFEVIPRIRVRAPKRLWTGVLTGQCAFDFRAVGAFEKFASFMTACGMRWMIWPKWQSPDGCDARAMPILRRAGFSFLTPYDCSLSDGYQVGPGYVRPKEERFVSDAKGVWYDGAICPVAVYGGMPYFRTYAEGGLRDWLEGSDGAWANWEPYPACERGCWCEKCRAAFCAYTGLSPEVVAVAWPREMKTGGVYEDLYVEFRAREFAKLVKSVDAWVRGHSGGSASQGFIPGVAWCEMAAKMRREIDAKAGHRYAREQSTREYASSLRWIAPWGPYPRWDTGKPYVEAKERYLNYFVAARDVREQLDREYGEGPKPCLMAHPSALQGETWVSQPEELSMAVDAFYFNGWRAVVPYTFPRGLDARYWRALAAATARAAKYEDWLLDGRRIDGQVSMTPVPEYAMPCGLVTPYVPAATNVSLLQSAAYRHKGTSIVAVFNYWGKGAAFFDLRITGLEDVRHAVIDEAGVFYAKDETCLTWTARELATRGVRLMAGAVRTRVFEVCPMAASAAREGAVKRVTQRQVNVLYERMRPELESEAQRDAAVEKNRRSRGWTPEAI